jgi:hypothetical protein
MGSRIIGKQTINQMSSSRPAAILVCRIMNQSGICYAGIGNTAARITGQVVANRTIYERALIRPTAITTRQISRKQTIA